MSTFKIIDDGVESKPLVSVALLTYNHGDFITKALESVLMQTGIPYEIVIADDASTDNTRNIILEYQKRYPQKIKLILQDKNVGPNKNEIVLLSNLSGRYIAFLEGDDYWTDSLKLQKQADFLEKNKGFSSCFHNVKMLVNGELLDDDMTEVDSVTTINDLAKVNYIRTCSYLFRNNLFREFSKDYEIIHGADYFLFMMIAKHGKIKKFQEVMAVYRKHGGSIWSTKSAVDRYKTLISNIEVMFPYFDKDVDKILREHQSKYIFGFITYLADNSLMAQQKDYISDLVSTHADSTLGGITVLRHYNETVKKKQENLKGSFKKGVHKIKSMLGRSK